MDREAWFFFPPLLVSRGDFNRSGWEIYSDLKERLVMASSRSQPIREMSQAAGDPSLESALSWCSESHFRHKRSSVNFKTGLRSEEKKQTKSCLSVAFRWDALARAGTFRTQKHGRSHLDMTKKQNRSGMCMYTGFYCNQNKSCHSSA